MSITVFTVFVRMSSYCICCLYPHGLHSLLDLEIKLSIYISFFFRFANFFVFIFEFAHTVIHLFEFGMRYVTITAA